MADKKDEKTPEDTKGQTEVNLNAAPDISTAPDVGVQPGVTEVIEKPSERLLRLTALNRPFVRAGNFPGMGRLQVSRLFRASLVHAVCSGIFLIVGSMLADLDKGDFIFLLYKIPVGDARSLAATLIVFSLVTSALSVYGSLRLTVTSHPVCIFVWLKVLQHFELFISAWTCLMGFLEASSANTSYERGVYVTGALLAMIIFCAGVYMQRFQQLCGNYERTMCCVWEKPYPLPSEPLFETGVTYREDFYEVLKVKADEEFKGREDGMTLEVLITRGVPDASGKFKDELEGEQADKNEFGSTAAIIDTPNNKA